MNSYELSALVGNLFTTLVPAVGAVIIGLRSAGRTRVLGVIGCVVSVLVGLGWVGWQFAIRSLDGPNSGTIAGVASLTLTLGQCVGLVLLIMAVVASKPSVASPPPTDPYGHSPGPATYQGPWSQA